ncbi:hypothetical protein [Arthrobacter sp. CG_A4]|uniref:hypothetical protein n=1 Tax=Arthrobacter sp. CG_A4 TaxID=3071706 RepID=UPI002E071260|nr:hypothetical protein [Arthrobacter sp. CG_A4]
MTELTPAPRPGTNPERRTASESDPVAPEELPEEPPEDAGELRPDWPPLPAGAAARDATVDALLERLGGLPGQPVAVHGEVYAGLHDDLMEALNDDVTGPTAAGES